MSALAQMPWVRACLLFWDWAACPQGQRKFACMPGSRVCGFCRPIITCMRACLLEGWGWLDAGTCLRQLPSSNSLGACLSSGKVGLRARKAIANLRACRGGPRLRLLPPYNNFYACVSFGRAWLFGRGPMSATIAVLKCFGCVLLGRIGCVSVGPAAATSGP